MLSLHFLLGYLYTNIKTLKITHIFHIFDVHYAKQIKNNANNIFFASVYRRGFLRPPHAKKELASVLRPHLTFMSAG